MFLRFITKTKPCFFIIQIIQTEKVNGLAIDKRFKKEQRITVNCHDYHHIIIIIVNNIIIIIVIKTVLALSWNTTPFPQK